MRVSMGPELPRKAHQGATVHELGLPNTLLSPAEVAVIFGRSIRTLWSWEQRGILVPIRVNKRRLYRLSDIEALIRMASEGAQSDQRDIWPE